MGHNFIYSEVEGKWIFDWQGVNQTSERQVDADSTEENPGRGALWLIDCTYWAISVRLIA